MHCGSYDSPTLQLGLTKYQLNKQSYVASSLAVFSNVGSDRRELSKDKLHANIPFVFASNIGYHKHNQYLIFKRKSQNLILHLQPTPK